ncbi:MAG: cofactor-independent phosphoglycerate mutase, partial [Bacteroidota bacterium]|nr:cofactor-independent phosphoglycerate mutase [Bacteroidota bacterium]
NIDKLAALGCSGMLKTIPEGFTPGSEIANLAVLGYDVPKVFEGRGSLEAASMGIDIEDGEMAMRCNLICIEDGKIKNHSAGHISNEEASELIEFLNKELSDDVIQFFPGVSYRHLLKMKGGDKHLDCTPPHDVPGTPFSDVMINALTVEAEATAKQLNELTLKSQQLLENHPVNIKRKAAGKDPANSIWLWSPGYRPQMKTINQLFGVKSGAVISAVDLIKGIGVYAGLRPIVVDGATGLYNTNYEGKAQAAIDALRTDDFVYLHIEASDEAGHEGDVALKVKTIEYLDSRVVKPIFEEVSKWDELVTIAVLPDHPTPCSIRTHTAAPVPFVIYRPEQQPDAVLIYDEFEAQKGSYGMLQSQQFMQMLLS